jgi:hypothetical protein
MQPCNLVTVLILLLLSATSWADDLAALVRNRAAIERVYYNHRLGQKPPFEEALAPATLEGLVRLDLKKEAVLRKAYGVTITPALLDAEVQRINTTTRAPDTLAEIRAALGNDSAKFAQAFAKPFLVERLLRERFGNDEALHAAQRREAEAVRNQLLQAAAGKSETRNPKAEGSPKSEDRRLQSVVVTSNLLAILKASATGQLTEATWQLGARPAETNAPAADEMEIKQRFSSNAQLISPPRGAERDRKQYFEDLPGELQRVLRLQLRQPGDVSAVIEAPGAFLLCAGWGEQRLAGSGPKAIDGTRTGGAQPAGLEDGSRWSFLFVLNDHRNRASDRPAPRTGARISEARI